MRYLRTNTATKITVGPFVDVTDGTPELAITPANCHLTLIVDVAGVPTLVLDTTPGDGDPDTDNDLIHITGDDAGFYSLELTAANVNYFGRAILAVVDDDVFVEVWHELSIVNQNWYDSMFT